MQMNLQKCMPLNSFVGHKSDEIIENAQEHLQNLESCILLDYRFYAVIQWSLCEFLEERKIESSREHSQ